MEEVMRDLRIAARLLLKSPSATLTALLTLALGIGANTAMFSVIEAVLLRQPAFAHPERLMVLRQTANGEGEDNLSAADFLDLRAQSRSFTEMQAYTSTSVSLTGMGEPEQLAGAFVTAGWFRLLGRQPLLGRGFFPNEDQPGQQAVVVLSHGLWARRFGSDRGVIGHAIDVNGEKRTVVGIMPPDFEPVSGEEIWLPITFSAADLSDRGRSFTHVLASLRPGVPPRRAQAEIDGLASRLARQYPATDRGRGFRLIPFNDWTVGDVRPILLMLFGAVGFLLLLVCANLTHLELARAMARQREAAIRTALGASPWRLVRERLTGAILLALVGGGGGVLLAAWGTRLLGVLNLADVPRLDRTSVDGRVLAFSLLISVATGVAFGILPALQTSRSNLQPMLKEGAGRATGGVQRQRLRSLLLVSEIALALVLLIGAGLLVQSFRELLRVDPGFHPERCLAMRVVLPQKTPPTVAAAFSHQVLERLRQIPLVRASGLVTNVPLTTSRLRLAVTIAGRPDPTPGQELNVDYDAIAPGYMRAIGEPLLRGRSFAEQDDARAPHVAMINEAMAERFWPGADPLGQRISFDGKNGPWATVVGITGNIRRLGLDTAAPPQVYVPFAQDPWFFMTFVVRTDTAPSQVAPDVRRAVWAVSPNQAIAWTRPMGELIAVSIAKPRLSMSLLALFAGIALVLTAVGIYGVMAHSVTQRMQEMGIRIALGASRNDVIQLVLRNVLTLTLIGLAIGLAVAFSLSRALARFLFAVSATDPLTFLTISVLLVGMAVVATYIPARRATKVEPSIALKRE